VWLWGASELALHKTLYDGAPGAFAVDGTAQATLHLHKCCDDVGDVSTEEAIFGSGAILKNKIRDNIRIPELTIKMR
jgi:hypothetical protein